MKARPRLLRDSEYRFNLKYAKHVNNSRAPALLSSVLASSSWSAIGPLEVVYVFLFHI